MADRGRIIDMWGKTLPLNKALVAKSSHHTDLVGVGWWMWGSTSGGRKGAQLGTLMKEKKIESSKWTKNK